MHIPLRENIEAYLSGNLGRSEQEALEAHLAGCAECREEWEAIRASADALRGLRPPRDLELEPAPGFYARVIDHIDHERQVPFWAMLLEPAFGRRLVFACLMLLALAGVYVAAFDRVEYPSKHRPEAVLTACSGPRCQPVLPAPAPRLGRDLDRNRGVVLAALVSEGD